MVTSLRVYCPTAIMAATASKNKTRFTLGIERLLSIPSFRIAGSTSAEGMLLPGAWAPGIDYNDLYRRPLHY